MYLVGPKVSAGHVFVLLFMFWSFWVYTEITEYVSRDKFAKEVKEFMRKGDRNTLEQGYQLCLRLNHLEGVHPEFGSEPVDCEEIYGFEK